MSIMLKIKI